MRVLVFIVAALALVAAAQCAAPVGWTAVSEAVHPVHPVSFTIAVKQQNLDVLEGFVAQVSDPRSPVYGQYLDLEQVGEMVGNPAGAEAIFNFLVAGGINPKHIKATANKDFIEVNTAAAVAEKVLKGKFSHYTHETGKRTVRMTSFELPAEIEQHVDFVSTVLFPDTDNIRPPMKAQAVGQSGSVTPNFIFQFYKVDNPVVASTKSTVAVYESLGQSFSPSDLSSFQSKMGTTVDAVDTVIGPNSPSVCAFNPNSCVEANLDVQYLMAMAQTAPFTYWSIDQNNQSPFVSWITAVANAANPPLVHSISYGAIENLYPTNLMDRFDAEVQKLAARGITVTVSSGDDGVANFQARSNSAKCGFNPSFPASAPHVTAIGATQGPEDGSAEVACQSDKGAVITTGGGFSSHFAQPSYQADAVKAYLASGVKLPSSFSGSYTNRGYPDVALLGHNYLVIDGGNEYQVSGTSASSPVFAGMIANINARRLAAGKSALGFLNPALYQLASTSGIFNDITVGENNCCAGQPGQQVCCPEGFFAANGWDPLTGLGSVNFPALASALESL